jgi:hypothetical protein
MPLTLKCVVSVPSIDLTLDGMTAQFIYHTDAISVPAPSDCNDIANMASSFYEKTLTGSSFAIKSYMTASLNWSHGYDVNVYDITGHLDGSNHGGPIYTGNKPNTSLPANPTSSVMPEGVAGALSYRSDWGTVPEFVYGPGHKVIARPRATYRGRHYIGPLGATAMDNASVTLRTKLRTQFMTDALNQLDQISTVTATTGPPFTIYHLVQWSKKRAQVNDIVATWIDDRPDYQRRRTDQSSVRQTGTFSY